jgi:hypothetical protein
MSVASAQCGPRSALASGHDLHCVASSARNRCATPPLRSGAPSPHLTVHGLSHGPSI